MMSHDLDNFTPSLDNTIDGFFALASARDLSTMLQRALQTVLQTFKAKAGSIFFLSKPVQHIKMGSCPPPILSQIDHLEEIVANRLQTGIWRILETDLPPISIQKFPKHSLILINTPLLKSTRVTGSLSLVLPDEQQFNLSYRTILVRLARGIGQLATFANDLSLAEKRYKELDLIYQVGQALSTTLDVNELLQTVMQLSANMLGAATASIMLIDKAREELFFKASYHPEPQVLDKYRINLNEGIAGWVATNGQPFISNDVAKEPRFSKKIDVRTGFLTNSIAAVPLRLKGDIIGVLEVLNKYSEDGFDEDDVRLMTSIAAQAAIAIENAKLYQSVMVENDRIMEAQETVRKSLSRNLHDGTVQQLSAISMNLEYARKLLRVDTEAAYNELGAIQEMANQAAKDARLVLFELRPLILETQGLIPALDQYVRQLNQAEDFKVEAEMDAITVNLSRNVAGTIFSIIQEAINNAKRHAKASLIRLTVSVKSNHLLVHIKDNGVGFDVSSIQTNYFQRNSLGLLNMKERAELIDGILAINSETEGTRHGTTVTLSMPLKRGTAPLKEENITSNGGL